MSSTTSWIASQCGGIDQSRETRRASRPRSDLLDWSWLPARSVLIASAFFLAAPGAAQAGVARAQAADDWGVGVPVVDISTPQGNASASASGVSSNPNLGIPLGTPWSSSASASFNEANYLELRISGSSSTTGPGNADASSNVVLPDLWTLSNATYDGQAGVITASILVDVGLSATFSSQTRAGALWQMSISSGEDTDFEQFANLAVDAFGTSEFCQINGANFFPYTSCNGSFVVTIPFTVGVPLDFLYVFYGDAFSNGVTGTGSSAYDGAHSLYWGGFSSVTVGGVALDTYDFTSESGVDWRQSGIPTNGAPEPATLALVGIGFAALGQLARPRR